MQIFMDKEYVSFFKALSSDTRLDIITLLSKGELSIKEIAEKLNLSSAIIVRHIRILEDENIISTHTVNINGSIHKKCVLLNVYYEIFPTWSEEIIGGTINHNTSEVEVGQYTDICVKAPCGLADDNGDIGDKDRVNEFFMPERINASLLWFSDGYVEYKFPNIAKQSQKIVSLELSGEFGSEHAGYKDDWPSSINVYINDTFACTFTVPGDFGSKKGLLTPDWWKNNQYGILISIKIDTEGIFVNGEKKSNITINQLKNIAGYWKVKFETNKPESKGCGLTIFGKTFGNYNQSLVLKQYFKN